MTQQTTPPGELAHHGVKGMKWGVRRAEANKPNPGYSQNDRARDSLVHPVGAVKRINRRMNNGMTLKEARKKETQRTLVKVGALVALHNAPRIAQAVDNLVNTHGPTLAASIHDRAETNRGRAYAAETMGLPRKPTSGPKYSKQNRNGVYKISNV